LSRASLAKKNVRHRSTPGSSSRPETQFASEKEEIKLLKNEKTVLHRLINANFHRGQKALKGNDVSPRNLLGCRYQSVASFLKSKLNVFESLRNF
jgi:hypothetical protein